jgi:hypothetical protein
VLCATAQVLSDVSVSGIWSNATPPPFDEAKFPSNNQSPATSREYVFAETPPPFLEAKLFVQLVRCIVTEAKKFKERPPLLRAAEL